jgi:polyhydroxybutyrate depolymerase
MRSCLHLAGPGLVCAAWIVACSSSHSSNGNAPVDGGGATSPDGGGVTGDASAAQDGGQDASPPPPGFTMNNETLTVGGMAHTYVLATPATYDATKKYPLVLAFHGNPGDPAQMIGTFPSSGQSAVLAYPAGLGNNWDLSTPPDQNLDVAFIKALPADIATKVNVDVSRVYGWGFSGGAFFLNQYVCRVSGTFKAFASMSGGAPYMQSGDQTLPDGCIQCNGDPTPALMMHGESDTEVPPGGSTYGASCWAEKDSCTQTDYTQWPAVMPAPCVEAAGCPVELCMIPNLCHGIWTSAADAAWAFFQAN